MIGIKNTGSCFFADIGSIDPLLLIPALKLDEAIMEVGKNQHFVTLLSKEMFKNGLKSIQ